MNSKNVLKKGLIMSLEKVMLTWTTIFISREKTQKDCMSKQRLFAGKKGSLGHEVLMTINCKQL